MCCSGTNAFVPNALRGTLEDRRSRACFHGRYLYGTVISFGVVSAMDQNVGGVFGRR